MAFHSNVFPRELSALTPKTSWQTQVTELGGGNEQRAALWGDARRRYNASNPTLTLSQFQSIEKHFNARRGRLFSFPLRDRESFRITVAEAFWTSAGGASETAQLVINSGDAGNAYNREIYLPESGTIHVYDNAVEKTEGVHWTLAYTGATAGLVTLLYTPTAGHVFTWIGDFWIPVRYDIDEMPDSKLFVWDSGTNGGLLDGPDIPMIEIRYPGEWV